MANARKPISPALKLAIDLGPLLIFFLGIVKFNVFVATALFMAAMMTALAISYAIERKVSPMPLMTAVLVLIFGGLTLWLNNEIFIKIKPTILYVLFALVLMSGLYFRRLFIKTLLGTSFQLPDSAWRTLTWRWSLFFLVLAVLNEAVWRNFSLTEWAAFKIWGVVPLTFLFALAQTPYMLRHQIAEEPPA